MPIAQLQQQRLAALPQHNDLVRPKTLSQPPKDPRLARMQIQKVTRGKEEHERDREEGEVSDDDEDELVILPNDEVSQRGVGRGESGPKISGIRGGDGGEGGGRGEEASKKMETSACKSKSAARANVVTLLSSSDEEDSNRKRQRTGAITIGSGSAEASRAPAGVGTGNGAAKDDVGRSLVCSSCARRFTFSEEERGRLLDKGVHSIPSSCRPCRMGQNRAGSGAAGSSAQCGGRTGRGKARAPVQSASGKLDGEDSIVIPD